MAEVYGPDPVNPRREARDSVSSGQENPPGAEAQEENKSEGKMEKVAEMSFSRAKQALDLVQKVDLMVKSGEIEEPGWTSQPLRDIQIKSLEERMKELEDQANEAGYLVEVAGDVAGVQRDIQSLEEALRIRRANWSDIRQFRKDVEVRLEKAKDIDESSVPPMFRGVKRHFLERELRNVYSVSAEKLETALGSSETAPERPPAASLETVDAYEQFVDYLNIEKWAYGEYKIDPTYPSSWPDFYKKMSPASREIFRMRTEILNAAHYKKNEGWTLEGLSKNTELSNISDIEMEKLLSVPGAEMALRLYARWVHNPSGKYFTREDGSTFTIAQINSPGDLDSIRQEVKRIIFTHLKDDFERYRNQDTIGPDSHTYADWIKEVEAYSSEEQFLDVQASLQEQLAFNLHYIGNTFESRAYRWADMLPYAGGDPQRMESAVYGGRSGNITITNALNPLDTAINVALKGDTLRIGNLQEWVFHNVQMSLERHGISRDMLGRNAIVPQIIPSGNRDEYWAISRTRDGRYVISVPEFYPRKLIGSVWEETEITVNDNGIPRKASLWEILSNEEPGQNRIPWSGNAEGIWGRYRAKLGAANKMWQFYDATDKPYNLGPGTLGSVHGATNELQPYVLEFKNVINTLRGGQASLYDMRWMLYSSVGVQAHDPLPRMALSANHKKVMARGLSTEGYAGYPGVGLFNRRLDVLFPWDRPAGMT